MNYADFIIQANEILKDKGIILISAGYNGGDVLWLGYFDEVIERSLFFNSEIKEFDFNSCIEAIIKNAEKHEYETYLKLKEKFGD